jgi:hypothetical protein
MFSAHYLLKGDLFEKMRLSMPSRKRWRADIETAFCTKEFAENKKSLQTFY